jgi:hypothetical protein
MTMGHNEKIGEMILRSSSQVQEAGYGLMSYLAPSDVRRFIADKVVMGPEVTTCSIPKGVFRDAGGVAVQVIGYGDELNIAYPPKPRNSSKPHEYIWALKLRNKSMGMLPLGQDGMREDSKLKDGRQVREDQPAEAQREEPLDNVKGTLNKLKGRFGFWPASRALGKSARTAHRAAALVLYFAAALGTGAFEERPFPHLLQVPVG